MSEQEKPHQAVLPSLASMRAGLVSTVIPVFNRAAMLREAVASVLAQTWRPIEIIIVDDGSTDDTPDAARELAAAHPDVVRVLTQPNAGPGVARQTGLGAARGEFVQFLDSDDRLLPEKFSLQVAGLRADPQAGISYGKTFTCERGLRSRAPAQRSGEQHRNIFPALLSGRLWETSTPLYRRSALDRIGPWPAKRQMEDWEFDAQAGAAGIALHYCDAWVCEYRIHEGARLAHAWMTDAQAMRDRLGAYHAILRHAKEAKVGFETRDMQTYSRTLFWVARSAGSAGYAAEANGLLDLAQCLAGRTSARAYELRLYRFLAGWLGWKTMGLLNRWIER